MSTQPQLKNAESHYRLAMRRINEYAKKVYPKKVLMLEVGAGSKLIEKFLEKNITYETLDIEGHDWTQGFRYTYNTNLDEEKFPIKDGKYDILVCNETLEHCAYPGRVVKEMMRVGKENAQFFFSVPNEYNFILRFYYLIGHKTPSHTAFDIVEGHKHIHLPTVKEILNFFNKDFKIKEVEYVWQSMHSEHSQIALLADKIIRIFLLNNFPSLFARVVVLSLRNKKYNNQEE